jgi:hypothetical protein
MFRYDHLVRDVVQRGLSSGLVSRLPPVHRIFVCCALSHQVLSLVPFLAGKLCCLIGRAWSGLALCGALL